MKKAIVIMILLLVMSFTMSAYAANITEAETQASALKQLGLFKGVSDTDFDLQRAPTRTEALVMLIRVLGKESEAINGSWSHPFTDVAAWADKYVGYAYQNGLTKGVSAVKFGTGNANSDMCLTFVLRALDYNDSVGDFAWNEPDTLAKSAGILPNSVDTENFQRADVALVSWAALSAKLKDGSRTLSGKLMEAGVFKSEEYTVAKQTAGEAASVPQKVTYEIKDGVALVKSMAELKGAMTDAAVSEIEFAEAFEISEDITITKALLIVEKDISSKAILTVKANVTLGGAVFENTGSVIISDGGFVGVYMTEFKNQGQFTVEKAGKLEMDRGGQLKNFGTLTNTGSITVTDNGGNLSNEGKGIIENNGVIDCSGYYNNFGTYTGTGTEPTGKK